MIRTGRLGLLLVGLLLVAPSGRASTINVATVSGGINPAVADYLQRAIARSEAEGVEALVIELDTPGGLLSSTKDIVSAILNAEVPVVVFVSPRGAWAGSAGTFITLAGHVAAMAPGTSIGAAHPVSFMPGGQRPKPGEKEAEDGDRPPARDIMGEKIENFTAAFIESIAETRDRNVEWAIEAVRNSEAITQKEALEKKVVDLLAEDLPHLLEQIDGRTVRVGRSDVELSTGEARVVRIPMGAVNRLFDVLADPQIALLLILGGMLGLYVEFTQPGMIAPGIAGVVCLILAGLSLQIIPFNWLGLLLVISGIGLMAAELFVTSFGLLFASGLVCMGVGGYMMFDVPQLSDLSVPFWGVVFPTVFGMGALGGIVVFGVSRSLFKAQFTGIENLLGQTAVVDRDIDPQGRIFLHGEYWTAEADEPVSRGETVKIVEVRDLILRVARGSGSMEGTS